MAVVAFDPLEYAQQLEAAGMPRAQAEVVAKGLTTMFIHNFDALVTKTIWIRGLRNSNRAWMVASRKWIHAWICVSPKWIRASRNWNHEWICALRVWKPALPGLMSCWGSSWLHWLFLCCKRFSSGLAKHPAFPGII